MTEIIDTRTPDPKRFIAGATGDWEVIIGLEVHAQVSSRAKLFSGASTQFGAEQNHNVSLVDAAMPGMLPVINAECVAQAVRTGLGLNAKINLRSVFDRKNYFYPDLPQGYQISHRVPNAPPGLRTETLTSARMDPCSMFPSQVPRYRMIVRNFVT